MNHLDDDGAERFVVRDVALARTFLGSSMRYRWVSLRKKIAPGTNAGEAKTRPSK